jgi:peptidoglycan LD-endopeptidase CwlK
MEAWGMAFDKGGHMTIDLSLPNRNINLLYPVFLEKVLRGLEIARSMGLMAYIFEGFRPNIRQEFLFAKGRSGPGSIITNAKAGFSWHNYGLAVDIVFDGSPMPGIQWAWDGDYVGDKKDDYKKLGDIMLAQGLEWLGTGELHDLPHFQLTRGYPITKAFTVSQKFSLLAVWDALDNT